MRKVSRRASCKTLRWDKVIAIRRVCIVQYRIIFSFHLAKRINHSDLGSKGGAVVRALASHRCGPGSNPGIDAICGLSLLLVLSFAPRGFSPGTPVFPSPQKPTIPNSNLTRNQVDEEPLCECAICKSLFIYLFIRAETERCDIVRISKVTTKKSLASGTGS